MIMLFRVTSSKPVLPDWDFVLNFLPKIILEWQGIKNKKIIL